MGGRGSGRRPSYAGQSATEDSMPLDIRRLVRAGVLIPGRICSWKWTVNERVRGSIQIRADAWQVTLSYRHTPHGRPEEVVNQAVSLETTPCTLGGRRQWFTCPACCRRVAVIYGTGRLFACRHCKGLAYASQGETDDDRAARRAGWIRKRLGWVPGIFNGQGLKPKGMHWQTFERLTKRHDAYVAVALEGMANRLGLLERLLGEARAHLDLAP